MAQENIAMLARLERRHALVGRDLVENRFVLDQIAAEPGRSPIGDDKAQDDDPFSERVHAER